MENFSDYIPILINLLNIYSGGSNENVLAPLLKLPQCTK